MYITKILLGSLLIAVVSLGVTAQTSPATDSRLVTLRKNLIDGSKAYKDRNFVVAEQLFREAVACDPGAETTEGKTALIFLARTLHSEYIGHRQDTSKADDAIVEYNK